MVTRECEENSPARPYIDEFEEETFWDELIDRLANRDILREIGEKKLLSINKEERMKIYFDFEERYQEEFEEHGVERLEINAQD